MLDLGRREFIALLGSTASWPFAVRAQQLRPLIGFLIPTSSDMQSDRLHALRKGLRETGFVEGENLTILVHQQASALLVTSDTLFHGTVDKQLSGLAARYAVPTVCQYPQFAAAGGLMGYGANLADAFLIGGAYVGRILKGAKPADLPVQQATKIKLAVNLKTARTLGLSVPPTLADEVIE